MIMDLHNEIMASVFQNITFSICGRCHNAKVLLFVIVWIAMK